MVYNISSALASRNLLDLTLSTNQILGGFYFGYFIMLIIWFVTFMILIGKQYHPSVAFSTSMWLVVVVGMLLRAMSLIDNRAWWVSVLIAGISVFVLFMTGTEG